MLVTNSTVPSICFSSAYQWQIAHCLLLRSVGTPSYLPLSCRQFKRCCFKQNHQLVCMREHLSFKCYGYLFQDKKKRTEMNKSRCNLFIEGVLIDAWWVCLWVSHVEREGFQNPHHAATLLSSQRRSLSGSLAGWFFSQQKGVRGSLERLEGLRRAWAEWKQMSGALDAKCACVCLRVCVQQPCSALTCFTTPMSFRHGDTYSSLLSPPFWLTEVWERSRDVQECRSASETENHHI